MKLPAKLLKVAARKWWEEAGKEVRPFKKSQREIPGRPTQAPVGAAPAEELGEDVLAKELARGDTPVTTEGEPREWGLSARREEDMEGPIAPAEPMGFADLEAGSRGPTRAELASAPAESKVRGDAARTRGEAGPTGGGGEGAATPSSPPRPESSTAGPRRPPGFSAMESGRLVERLLERVFLSAFHEQLRREPISGIFDINYVSLL